MTSWTASTSMRPRAHARGLGLEFVAFAVVVPGSAAGQTSDRADPMAEYLSAVRTALALSATHDAAACRLPGRTRHVFTDDGVAAIAGWLGARLDSSAHSSEPGRASEPDLTPSLAGCLADDSGG